ncbi:MAG: type I restriction endonuclease subunit R [Saprospiraceae bacterium]|nr:type I restriction endonuclease subunit R [Saprospiraceae bacterium]MCF8250213.1 type I restriction endonuclease subunit R [Saprospiraceae bacterium]MCF8280024.1 type I restriction endonuclease subunit R [Bacteroidales bacterium]MCF8312021.1 type I restriction endonuclease subunit R [Saprospiraceae bacterium]MCF8441118.1 type I restriction endonuclease subunit R [Saprospiraceae bacterium]
MSYTYSEDNFIEKTAIAIFKEMDWQTTNVYQGERFGAGGTLGRASEADVVLRERFMAAVRALNPDLPEAAYLAALEEIASDNASRTLPDLNHEKYKQLKEGIPVDFINEKGERVEGKRIRVFNFDEPEKNDFLAVQQMWMEGKSKRRKRPDIVGFVNGIPLVFIELKAHHRKLKVAFETNLADYKDTIPRLFHCNAVIILSNGFDSKIGSLTSKFEHFHEWKRIRENEEGVVSLDTILKGVCEKAHLLDIFENFILFDVGDKLVKLIARNHQFIGVNKAVDHFKNQLKRRKNGEITKEEAQRLGVFWHTQGSGKSYSMVFLCQKIQRQFGGAYTFVLVTDRVELNTQIYGTFAGVGAVTNKKAKAASGKDLKEILGTDEKYVFSLIHKFNFEGTVTERENIIVISDEAHRTQGGTLALNMRKALPNASFIGFTGTPLFKDDELTRRIFGDYVSVYDFKRSIEDGATVPLYYENRGEKLRLDNPKINDEIRTAIEAAELDEDQTEKLKRLFAKDYPILTAEKRLRSIARDVVEHFNNRGYKGKAMFVALDKLTAVRMFDYISEEQTKYLERRKKEIEKLTDEQEALTQAKALQWSEETEMGVVVSHEQNEIQRFTAWGLDIEPHRLKMNERDLEKEFKEDENPFRFVIVCAMWLTGFDVKSLSTLYIDKPMKSHTLMQTIARANRVHDEWKNNGLIVDYIETYKALLEALAVYAIGGDKNVDGGGGGEPDVPVKPLEDLVEDLQEAIEATVGFLRDDVDFDLDKAIEAEGVWKIKAVQEGVNAVCLNDESRNKFGVLGREVFKKFKALFPDKTIYAFQPQRDAINAIYAVIYRNEEESDISAIVRQVQDVVDKSIESLNIALDPVEGHGNKIDLSGLDFERIEREFLKLGDNQPVAVQSLKDKIADKLNQMLRDNPFRVDYYERYQRIIAEYNTGKEYGAIKEIFDQLINFYGDLSEEEKRSVREDVSEEELAVLDMLSRDKKVSDKEKAELKEIAKQLLERLKENEFRVVNWFEKEQTKSAVRVVINNCLFERLPYPAFVESDIDERTEMLFEFFRKRYDGRVAA